MPAVKIPTDQTITFTDESDNVILTTSLLELQLLLEESQWGLGETATRVRAWIPGFATALSKLADGKPISEAQAYRIAEYAWSQANELKKKLASPQS